MNIRCWFIGSEKYVKYDFMTIEKNFFQKSKELPNNSIISLSNDYHPTADESKEFDFDDTTFF